MKNKLFSALLGLALISLTNQSCKSSKATTQSVARTEETTELADPAKTRLDRFISVEAVADLKAGMSVDEVVAKLGSKPHNLISAQADGHHIVQYKYRLTSIEVNAEDVNNYGLEKKNNKTYYRGGEEDLYIVFNGAGKLEYLVTSQGGMNEKLLRDNNLLYVIKKDKDKFAASGESQYRETNSGAFGAMVVCPSCESKKDGKSAVNNASVGTTASANTGLNTEDVAEPAASVQPAANQNKNVPVVQAPVKKKKKRIGLWVLLALIIAGAAQGA
jgi:hypothetical protein